MLAGPRLIGMSLDLRCAGAAARGSWLVMERAKGREIKDKGQGCDESEIWVRGHGRPRSDPGK